MTTTTPPTPESPARQRVVIAGGPKTGKTTLATREELGGHRVRHTDDLIGKLDWSAASLEVSTWLDEPGPWIVEGVATVRALRKWLARNPEGAPCDLLLVLTQPFEPLLDGQARMAKGVHTVLAEIRPELEARGVMIDVGASPDAGTVRSGTRQDNPATDATEAPATRTTSWATVRTSLEDALHDAERIPAHTVCAANRVEIIQRIRSLIGRVREEEEGR